LLSEALKRAALGTVAENGQARFHAPVPAYRDGADGDIEAVEKC